MRLCTFRKNEQTPEKKSPTVTASLNRRASEPAIPKKSPHRRTDIPPSGAQEEMCTQEIIWCSCGHGELLPVVKCAHAEAVGMCWTVVHGDHRVVLQMKCSYCLSGLAEYNSSDTSTILGTKARPEGKLAAKIEMKERERLAGLELEFCEEGGGDRDLSPPVGELPLELEDVVGTEWTDIVDLDPELWQYV